MAVLPVHDSIDGVDEGSLEFHMVLDMDARCLGRGAEDVQGVGGGKVVDYVVRSFRTFLLDLDPVLPIAPVPLDTLVGEGVRVEALKIDDEDEILRGTIVIVVVGIWVW